MIPFNFHSFGNRSNIPTYQAMKPVKGHIIAFLCTVVVFLISFYILLPAISIRTSDTTFYIVGILACFVLLDCLILLQYTKLAKSITMIAVTLVVFVISMRVISSPLFQASAYQKQLNIEQTTQFSEKFEEVSFEQIPIIDLQTARQLGDKKMGTISALGSQFHVSDEYTLISVKEQLYRVAPLEYQDVFKWFQNRNKGIPGFIKVNVTDPNDVELVTLDHGMKYSPSAYFQQNLQRHVRMHYPFVLLDDYSFELDDEGKPYWVITTYLPKIGLYSGNDATGVIVVDPIDGSMEHYDLEHVPEWVDRVQPAAFALTQLQNWGNYVNGYFNTWFSQKDMLSLTDSFNYMVLNGQTHIFTGMTSTGGDRSINGFALINLKTKDAQFFEVNGADEYSAKQSAEGAVQNLGYLATDPLILNIANKPTYFVALKDQAGLVKKYGFVSLENYAIVGIGDTVQDAQKDYIKKLSETGNTMEDSDLYVEKETRVISIKEAVLEGTTHYYIQAEGNDQLWIAPLSISEELPLTKENDRISVKFYDTKTGSVKIQAFDNLEYAYDSKDDHDIQTEE